LPSRWWCSPWSVLAGMFFLDLFCGGIVSCFSAETRWAPMLGVFEITDEIPNTRDCTVDTFKHNNDARGDKESPQRLLKPQKLWISLHVPSRPLLYGDEWTFRFRKHPQTQRIFLVWTCTWMSFTSHIFTSLPLVHTPNPDFLRRRLWLCFLLIRESPRSGNLYAPWLPNLTSSRFPNFADFWFRDFAGSWLWLFVNSRLWSFVGSRFQIFACSRLQGFASSRLQIFACPWLQSFAGSRF
jgi:hypothetical protein